MKPWEKFYKPWTKKDYDKHLPAWIGFLNKVAEFTPKGGKILEVGFGTGMMSIYLSKIGYNVTGIDTNQTQLERAIRLNKEIGGKAKFILQDIFETNFPAKSFDTSFSQGLLEHYQDKDIRNILNIQAHIAKTVIFSVPLDKFGHQSRGDERLLPKEYWIKLVKGYQILHVSTFAKDTQLICVIKP